MFGLGLATWLGLNRWTSGDCRTGYKNGTEVSGKGIGQRAENKDTKEKAAGGDDDCSYRALKKTRVLFSLPFSICE